MKFGSKLKYLIVCVLLLLIGWSVVIFGESDSKKQERLYNEALLLMEDKIYVTAIDTLEPAVYLEGDYNQEVLDVLKDACWALIEQRVYSSKYIAALEYEMAKDDGRYEPYLEAAEYYLALNKIANGLSVLKIGIEATGSQVLIDVYEDNRYVYKMGYNVYADVSDYYNGLICVKVADSWGLASTDGTLLISCLYDKVSTYSNGEMIVQQDDEIFAVNSDGNRIALLKTAATDFTNYANNRLAVKTTGGWIFANGDLAVGSTVYEEIGMFSDGYVAVKLDGNWILQDTSGETLTEESYDEIYLNDLGEAYNQGCFFAKEGSTIYLISETEAIATDFEDVKPFEDSGYAAVKQNGKWGFIDTNGELVISCQFDDAKSFGGHLAAVKIDENWGYVSLLGEVVIEPQYINAKTFSGKYAPVETIDGWEFIVLYEEL